MKFLKYSRLELSQTSKKLSILISQAAKRQFEVILDCRPRCLTINTPRKSYHINLDKKVEGVMNIGSYKRHTSADEQKMTLHWKKHWISLFYQIVRIFKCPVTAFYTGSFLSLNEFQLIMKFIMRRQSEIQQLHIRKNNIEEKFMLKILNTLAVRESLFLNSNSLPQNFHYKYGLNSISFWSCKWFTLNSLLATRSVTIELLGSSLTNEDLNVFLLGWKQGKYPRLAYLSIGSDSFNDSVPILGMMPPIRNENPNPEVIRMSFGNSVFSITGGVQIRRDDGMAAWIKFGKDDGLSPNLMKLSLIVGN
ncbi:hypothetical protein CRE_09396 [Caenorhabditis remanei]|uniref:Sdz-33 F-box domain-containing protein n=1 Tax=Caenorhabditis remanei TaxID=31234 RepID=E3LIL4_CAERE|nr:hypothetical protein CRE_09396 [Caenorhabditis remanei]